MSITDELREEAQGFGRYVYTPPQAEHLTDIADRIDAEHEHAVMSAMNDALYHANDESMAELGWVRLPVDADGEYIHIGDVLQWPEDGDTFEVIGIGDDGVLFYFDPDTEGETADWTASQNKRHYREPTVVDVLREFAEKVTDSQIPGVRPTYEEAIAEYAAKLRLAEGEDA